VEGWWERRGCHVEDGMRGVNEERQVQKWTGRGGRWEWSMMVGYRVTLGGGGRGCFSVGDD
jgi:hypothetical protein